MKGSGEGDGCDAGDGGGGGGVGAGALNRVTRRWVRSPPYTFIQISPEVVPDSCIQHLSHGSQTHQQLHNTSIGRQGSKKQIPAKRSANSRDGRRQSPERPYTDSVTAANHYPCPPLSTELRALIPYRVSATLPPLVR
ncbi:hypothetical protein E2C01_050713 [Portunus trituberculatus]|uniref:Uncharacterized protein n=1 Tax=Portunus trituberculatus TaxID=210409 RepID=A0A5B7GGQ8_PORTR|nr:hypothetical protein [Portunus trituberculatus]